MRSRKQSNELHYLQCLFWTDVKRAWIVCGLIYMQFRFFDINSEHWTLDRFKLFERATS